MKQNGAHNCVVGTDTNEASVPVTSTKGQKRKDSKKASMELKNESSMRKESRVSASSASSTLAFLRSVANQSAPPPGSLTSPKKKALESSISFYNSRTTSRIIPLQVRTTAANVPNDTSWVGASHPVGEACHPTSSLIPVSSSEATKSNTRKRSKQIAESQPNPEPVNAPVTASPISAESSGWIVPQPRNESLRLLRTLVGSSHIPQNSSTEMEARMRQLLAYRSDSHPSTSSPHLNSNGLVSAPYFVLTPPPAPDPPAPEPPASTEPLHSITANPSGGSSGGTKSKRGIRPHPTAMYGFDLPESAMKGYESPSAPPEACGRYHVVFDTSSLISSDPGVMNLALEKWVICIPYTVLDELDCLSKGKPHLTTLGRQGGYMEYRKDWGLVEHKARSVRNWVLSAAKSHPSSLRLQSRKEFDDTYHRNAKSNDDYILGFAVFLMGTIKDRVIFVTEDQLLHIKALAELKEVFSYGNVKKELGIYY